MANRTKPHRLSVDLETDLYEWIQSQRAEDHIDNTSRVRALLALSRDDDDLRSRVSRKVTEMTLQPS